MLFGLGTIARLPSAMIFIVLLFRARETTGSYSVAGIASGAYVAARAVSTPSVGRLELEVIRVIDTPEATHIRYRVQR